MTQRAPEDMTAMCDRLEKLLQEQREAIVHDRFDVVEARSAEIAELVVHLKARNELPTGTHLEQLRALNDRVMLILAAKKETTAADIANIRRKRDLTRLYRTHEE